MKERKYIMILKAIDNTVVVCTDFDEDNYFDGSEQQKAYRLVGPELHLFCMFVEDSDNTRRNKPLNELAMILYGDDVYGDVVTMLLFGL